MNILLHFTDEDTNYLPMLKPLIAGRCTLFLDNTKITSSFELLIKAKAKQCERVITTSEKALNELVGKVVGKRPTLDDYAGSIVEKHGIEFLILNPLFHLVAVPYGKFLAKRYLDKFLAPEKWLKMPAFKWELFEPKNTDAIIDYMASCDFIAEDIETGHEDDRVINCCSYTGIRIDRSSGTFTQRTVVIPFMDHFSSDPKFDNYNYIVAKVLNELPVPKCFQNGKYDNAYFLRYDMAVTNWAFDTQCMFHAWYSEFPKRLDFITSFMLRNWQFWKNESSDPQTYYQYNAKDSFGTAMAWLALMQEVPEFAWKNYLMKFPVMFPCLLADMTGLNRDNEFMEKEETRFNASLSVQLQSIRKMVGSPTFNPSSSKQTLALFKALGSEDIKSTVPAGMDKVMNRHPINKRILTAIQKYRKDRKIVTSYLRDVDPKTNKRKSWNGRIFYSTNPDATDTGRLASKESYFWCGWQIQNIPRDRPDIQIKSGITADEGFNFGECDYSQNEARGVAYLSGDTGLIRAVDDVTKDFHGLNASAFFGVPYESIVKSYYDEELLEWIHEIVDAALRDLSKRTNHGSNYNMGAGVLLDTMGIERVLKARKLLKLPAHLTLKQVTQHLLNVYAQTYPVVKGAYYDKIVADVLSTSKLVGPTGWTRYCFADPSKNKHYLNAYVAHPSQSLAAMCLNRAYVRVYREVAVPNPTTFRLGPQIHDSILFQYRKDREDLAWKVKNCMHFAIPVTDVFNKTRTLTVPVDLKGNSNRWGELKKMRLKKAA